MVMFEEIKTLPFGEVWAEYLRRHKMADDISWFDEIQTYEKEVLSKRV